jgi:uncharacterized Tic20 family protein
MNTQDPTSPNSPVDPQPNAAAGPGAPAADAWTPGVGGPGGPGGPGGVGPGGGVGGPRGEGDDRTIATLTHLSLLLGATTLIVPLIVWIVKKDASPYLNDQAKEALNFHISMLIYGIASAILAVASCWFLFFLPIVVVLFGVVFAIIAAIASSRGEYYRYPMCLRLVK